MNFAALCNKALLLMGIATHLRVVGRSSISAINQADGVGKYNTYASLTTINTLLAVRFESF